MRRFTKEEKEEKQKRMAKAQEIWAGMDDNQRHGVRFGLFPAEVMREAEAQGYKGLSIELMDIAKNNGGMRA